MNIENVKNDVLPGVPTTFGRRLQSSAPATLNDQHVPFQDAPARNMTFNFDPRLPMF